MDKTVKVFCSKDDAIKASKGTGVVVKVDNGFAVLDYDIYQMIAGVNGHAVLQALDC